MCFLKQCKSYQCRTGAAGPLDPLGWWHKEKDHLSTMQCRWTLCFSVSYTTLKHQSFQPFFFFKILFIFRERGREGEKISMCGCLLHTLNGGPGPQCKHMPWLGIEPATFQFTGRHSLHWATPARAFLAFLKIKLSSKSVLFLLKTTLETHHKEKQHKQWNWRASVLVNLKQAVRGGTLKVTKGCYYLSRTLSHTSPESSGGGTWEGS